MRTEWHVYEGKINYLNSLNLTYLKDVGPFVSKKQAQHWTSRALPKGNYIILEVFVVED